MKLSLRLRLGLWYGALTGLVVLFVCVVGYAEHTRAHYDDLDSALVASASHVAAGFGSAETPSRLNDLLTTPVAPEALLRAYDKNGTLLASAPGAKLAPAVDPAAILNEPSVHPFDLVAGLAPSIVSVNAGHGKFGIITSAQRARWRVYVDPLQNGRGDLVAMASLDRIDAAITGFRELMLLLTIAGSVVALLAGWLLAARALRPVARLTDTAGSITRSHHLGQRVPLPGRQDEMGRMATTFNEMLDWVEQSYQLQRRFVADASHELRAPLTAIQGNLEILERQRSMPEVERAEVVHEANREARRMALLVSDLLSLARADSGLTLAKQPVELDRALLDTLREARHLAQAQQVDVQAIEPTIVQGDPDRLKQLFLIVLDNAFKYTGSDGTVALALRRTKNTATVTVWDSGIGIPQDDLPHVFERFYRADPARSRDPGGTGLGLAIAQWIVEQHGGEISIASDSDTGTSVTISLPLSR